MFSNSIDPSARLRRAIPWLCASAGALCLSGSAWSQSAPVRVPPPGSLPQHAPTAPPRLGDESVRAFGERPLYDEAEDGALWVRTDAYKARFDARGASVVPFFGARAARNHPLAFEVASARRGALALALASGSVEREGDLVRIDHGEFVEEYALAARSLEQRFVFPRSTGAGELALRIAVASELAASSAGDALVFENELGRVEYGRAFAVDAAGRRVEMERALVDGAIELRVPASFADAASFPLVVDPVVSFFPVAEGAHDEIESDVAYDASTDRWCVTWVDVWSQTDHDVLALYFSGAGAPLDAVVIDVSSVLWTTPAIANNAATHGFLVCAAVVPASGVADVRGRFLFPATSTSGPAFPITPTDGSYRNAPDVGGDTFPATPTSYGVVWQHSVSASQVDVEFRIVSPSGALGPIVKLNTVPGVHLFPSIASSIGQVAGDGTETWGVAWQTQISLTNNDITFVGLDWNGAIRTPPVWLITGGSDDTRPSVSSVLDSTGPGEERSAMIVWEHAFTPTQQRDLWGTVMRGGLPQTWADLVGHFDPEHGSLDQSAPSTDADGQQFVVAFEERAQRTDTNADLYTCTFFLDEDRLHACEERALLVGSSLAETGPAIASSGPAGGPHQTFFLAWRAQTPNHAGDVHAALFNDCDDFPIYAFCGGNQTITPCPCGNEGSFGRGCGNSAHVEGASLSASGGAHVGNDAFVLEVSGSVPNQPGLFFQGDQSIELGVPFGDGLRCVGGHVRRIQVRVADASGFAHSTVDVAAQLGLEAGDHRAYQWWYRDPASTCGSQFNLSNGIQVVWLQ